MNRSLLFFIVLSFRFVGAYTIVLDPGHGEKYTGTVSADGTIVEKDMVLKLTKKLAQCLSKAGYKVLLTREGDEVFNAKELLPDLIKRAQFATDNKADIFVSIHLNASTNKQIHGYEVYVPYEAKYPIKSYGLASAIHYALSHAIEPQFYGGTLGNLNALDRGIRASRFNVLMRTTCPAVLVELGYLSHPPTVKLLKTEEYQDILVNGLCAGIRRYILHAQKR